MKIHTCYTALGTNNRLKILSAFWQRKSLGILKSPSSKNTQILDKSQQTGLKKWPNPNEHDDANNDNLSSVQTRLKQNLYFTPLPLPATILCSLITFRQRIPTLVSSWYLLSFLNVQFFFNLLQSFLLSPFYCFPKSHQLHLLNSDLYQILC